MSEIKSHIEQMLADAEAKEQERQTQNKQRKISGTLEKISSDRTEQVTRNEQSVELRNQEEADENSRIRLMDEKAELAKTQSEVEAKLAGADIGEEARSIYQKALDTIIEEQNKIDAELLGLNKDNTATHFENNEFIERTSKEASEVLSYKGNQFPKIAEHVEQLRGLQQEASEISNRIHLDQLANQIFERIITGRGTHYDKKGKYIFDLSKESYNDPKFSREIIDNPYVAKAFRDKVFERIDALSKKQETFDRSDEGYREIKSQLESAFGATVELKYTDPVTKQEISKPIWNGGSFWNDGEDKLRPYDTEAMRLPQMDYTFQQTLSEDQKTKIQEAISNPSISLETLKDELGYKFDEEALGSIMAEAQKEDQQFDAEKAEKERLEQIENVQKRIEEEKESLRMIEGRKEVSKLADEYRKLSSQLEELARNKRQYQDAHRHESTVRDELEKINNDTNFLGMVKDRAGKARLEAQAEGYQKEASDLMGLIQKAPRSLGEDTETMKRKLFELIIKFQATGYSHVTVDLAAAESNADQYVSRYMQNQNSWNKEDQDSEKFSQDKIKRFEQDLNQLEQSKK